MQTTERWFMREALREIWVLLREAIMRAKVGEMEEVKRAERKIGAIIDRLNLEDERESKSQGGQ